MEALGSAAGREGRENVVGLEVFFRESRDAHGRECLLQQGHLPHELGRRLASRALVLGVFARAERVARDVEGHRDVRRLLFREQAQEHREEAVDGVRVLPVARDEAVDRQGVERPERERVAVDDEEDRLF